MDEILKKLQAMDRRLDEMQAALRAIDSKVVGAQGAASLDIAIALFAAILILGGAALAYKLHNDSKAIRERLG